MLLRRGILPGSATSTRMAGRKPAKSTAANKEPVPEDQTLDALAYVEQGRANGKVIITLD